MGCKEGVTVRCQLMATDDVAIASGTGLAVVCSSSIGEEDGFEEGFPEMENFQHIIDLKSYEKS